MRGHNVPIPARYRLPKHTQEEIDELNSPKSTKEIKFLCHWLKGTP